MRFRVLHRWLAQVSLGFIAISAITGLLWAYAPYLYWQPGYKSIKHEIDTRPLDVAQIKLEDALVQLVTYIDTKVKIMSASLKSEAGLLIYTFHYQTPDGAIQAVMMDAISGEWLSPLTEMRAIHFARLYVEGKPEPKEIDLLSDWVPRRAAEERPAWRIRFDDTSKTEIFIDPYTGEVLEELNTLRRFHFWVMKLHQYQFFGTNKELSIVAGLPLLLLIVTGGWLAFPKLTNKFKKR